MSIRSPSPLLKDTASQLWASSREGKELMAILDSSSQAELAARINGFLGQDGQQVRIIDIQFDHLKDELLKLSDTIPADSAAQAPAGINDDADPLPGNQDAQSSGQSPAAMFRRAINFMPDSQSPVQVADDVDNDGITDLQAQIPSPSSLLDTAILDTINFDPDNLHHATIAFVSDMICIIKSGLQDHMTGLSQHLTANQLMQDKLKLWKRNLLSALEILFENKDQQIINRELCLEQIIEQSANLTQLSIRDDADEDDIKECETDLTRLNTVLKTSGTLLEHIASGVVKLLNKDQPMPMCSFSRSLKSGGLSSAKASDFLNVKISDEALKIGNDPQQLISMINLIKGLMATYPTELCVLIPQILQIFFERNMEHRTAPPMLFNLLDSSASTASSSFHNRTAPSDSGMSDLMQAKYVEQSSALFDVCDRTFHSSLQMTLRPMKDSNHEIIRSAPGDIATSVYMLCTLFKKSGFVLRRKYVELFSAAYLKIATTSNILECLRLLQSFIAEALIVETMIEYESFVRFCNALRIRDITFAEPCAKMINVTDSELALAGILHNALPVFDVFLSEAIEECIRYGIGQRPSSVNLAIDSSLFDRTVNSITGNTGIEGTALAVDSAQQPVTEGGGSKLKCSVKDCSKFMSPQFSARVTATQLAAGQPVNQHCQVCSTHFNDLIFKGVKTLELKDGKPKPSVTKDDFPRRKSNKSEARKAAALAKDSDPAAGGEQQKQPAAASQSDKEKLLSQAAQSLEGKSEAELKGMVSRMSQSGIDFEGESK